jgi:hypothetical protein
MDVMYFTRHVVAWHATCQSPIGSYCLLGGNMLTRGTLTRGRFCSDGPRSPSFDRTAHQYAKFEKKVTDWVGICWHMACWHVADFDRTVHVYRAGTCHAGMTNCEKVPLARQIWILCVSTVSRMESSFFLSRKCFFLLMPLQAAGLLGLRFRAPNGVTSRVPATWGSSYGSGPDWHVAHVTRVNCSLVDTVLKPTQHATWKQLTRGITWLVHVASSATCQALIGPYNLRMSVGVDAWQPRGRFWSDGSR